MGRSSVEGLGGGQRGNEVSPLEADAVTSQRVAAQSSVFYQVVPAREAPRWRSRAQVSHFCGQGQGLRSYRHGGASHSKPRGPGNSLTPARGDS
jgi:hypothetical protein